MADPKSDHPPNSLSEKDVKSPNLFERAKEEFESVLHQHPKETHGLRDDINENSTTSDVRAPNVFDRAKEEIEAIVEAIHPKKEAKSQDSSYETRDSSNKGDLKCEKLDWHSEKNVKEPNLIEGAKEELESLTHKEKPSNHHYKETHGMSDDIDENTPISEVKGPSVFERAKEEIEALIETIHPKKDPGAAVSSPKKEGGLSVSIGRRLEKICSPRRRNKD